METKVTQEQVDAAIKEVEFNKMGEKTCVGLCKLKNGFEICESASCVSPEEYDPDVGASLVMHRIKDRIWMLLGYELQTKLALIQPKTEPEKSDETPPTDPQ